MIVHTRTNVYDFNFHLVWVTKYRKEVFDTEEKRLNMKGILTDIAADHQFTIQEIEVMPDHIHLLISFHPKHSASSVVKTLKGKSARYWFDIYPETKEMLWDKHLWSRSYFMSTLGNMSKEIVRQYIQNQIKEYNAGRPRH